LSTLHLLVFSSILPIFCSYLRPPTLAIIVVYYLRSSLTKAVVSRWSLSRKPLSHFWSPNSIWLMPNHTWHLLCQITTMQTYMDHQIYLILSSPVASNFFCLHHGCRFVCARIKYFLSLVFYPCCIFQCLRTSKI
jgi:hypothetical protein